MAAAAPAASGGTGGAWPAAATTSRFAAACGALSQYVKAAEAPARRPLPLMPGADVDEDPAATGAALPAQMTIVYGDRVLVLDAVPADRAVGLMRLATAAAARGGGPAAAEPARTGAAADLLLPVARKASLQRFMEKRKVRAAARVEPYRRPDGSDACPVAEDHLKLAL